MLEVGTIEGYILKVRTKFEVNRFEENSRFYVNEVEKK